MNGFAIALMVLVIPGCDRDPVVTYFRCTPGNASHSANGHT